MKLRKEIRGYEGLYEARSDGAIIGFKPLIDLDLDRFPSCMILPITELCGESEKEYSELKAKVLGTNYELEEE